MGDQKQEVYRYEGWDQEKAEYFERVTCPVCGYRATIYEHGDVVVDHERDPSCPCCEEAVASSAPVVPDEYGRSSMGDSQDEGFGCIGWFMALLFLPVILALFAVNVLGLFH